MPHIAVRHSAKGCTTSATWKVRTSSSSTDGRRGGPSGSPTSRWSSSISRWTSSWPGVHPRPLLPSTPLGRSRSSWGGAGDPVGTGLVASLARPGGNVTGLSTLTPELGRKRLQLLKEVVPGVSRVAVLWNAANPYTLLLVRETEAAARTLGVQVQSLEVRGPDDFESA